MTDRATPGLVAFYNIRPGNGAGLFLQPRSPHGAVVRLSFDCESTSNDSRTDVDSKQNRSCNHRRQHVRRCEPEVTSSADFSPMTSRRRSESLSSRRPYARARNNSNSSIMAAQIGRSRAVIRRTGSRQRQSTTT